MNAAFTSFPPLLLFPPTHPMSPSTLPPFVKFMTSSSWTLLLYVYASIHTHACTHTYITTELI